MAESWPFRGAFKSAVRDYQQATGKTQEQVAEDLGTTLGTLRVWMYSKTKRPSIDVLQRAAAVFGVSVTEFLSDPGAKNSSGVMADPETEFLSKLIIRDIGAEDLSAEDRRALYDAFRWHLDQLRRQRSR